MAWDKKGLVIEIKYHNNGVDIGSDYDDEKEREKEKGINLKSQVPAYQFLVRPWAAISSFQQFQSQYIIYIVY